VATAPPLPRGLEVPAANRIGRGSIEIRMPGRDFHDDLAHATVGQYLHPQMSGALNSRSPGRGRIGWVHLVAAARTRPRGDATR
jgi:hypothetical protein